MPDTTPAAMRLAKELNSLGLVYRWDSVARALDDAGVREAVEALTNLLRGTHGQSWSAKQATRALAALNGTKEVSDE